MNELIEKFWIEQGGKPHMDADIWFYENDWVMLIAVLEKIHLSKTYKAHYAKEPQGVDVQITMKGCSIVLPDTSEGYDYVDGCYNASALLNLYCVKQPTLIQNVYWCVCEYIKWFNEQKK